LDFWGWRGGRIRVPTAILYVIDFQSCKRCIAKYLVALSICHAAASGAPLIMATKRSVDAVVARRALKASATRIEIIELWLRDSFKPSSWICCPWYSGSRNLIDHSFRIVLSRFSNMERGGHTKRFRG
jgi:hypothetical protein